MQFDHTGNTACGRQWFIHQGHGPVLCTAVHAGHQLRSELRPFLYADDESLRREEDPLTDVLASMGDDVFCSYQSRFEVDLNRSREKAFATDPKETWGMQVWRERPPEDLIEQSLSQHDCFYRRMAKWIEAMIEEYGKVLLLDIHSYNHRRNGPDAPPMPAASNPHIDLGLTTLDAVRFGSLAESFSHTLAQQPCQDIELDVRGNVRYPDGGHWPEWVYANYGDDVCTITLEYKKFYMDEWSGQGYLPIIEDLRAGLAVAIESARRELGARI